MKKALSFAALALVTLASAAFAADNYDVSVKSASGKAGEKATATVSVKAKNGYHINKEYPHKLILTAVDGVTLDKEKLVAADAALSEESLSFNVGATAGAAGTKTIDATLKSAVCTKDACVPFTETVKITVTAK